MKCFITFFLFLILSQQSHEQIGFNEYSGIYEQTSLGYTKLQDIEYKTKFAVDTITHQVDLMSAWYTIYLNNSILLTLHTKFENSDLKIILVYADYTVETLSYRISKLEPLQNVLKYENENTTFFIVKTELGNAVMLINLPFKYKLQSMILHLKPVTK
jgi:hypothetical protein